MMVNDACRRLQEVQGGKQVQTYLLHNACLALRESDVTTRLVANEFYFNFASLASTLFVIIVIVVSRRCALALDAATLLAAVAISD